MAKLISIDEQIARTADILEQVQDLNKLIALHQKSEDDFMLQQYQFRRAKLLKELRSILSVFQITPADLAA